MPKEPAKPVFINFLQTVDTEVMFTVTSESGMFEIRRQSIEKPLGYDPLSMRGNAIKTSAKQSIATPIEITMRADPSAPNIV